MSVVSATRPHGYLAGQGELLYRNHNWWHIAAPKETYTKTDKQKKIKERNGQQPQQTLISSSLLVVQACTLL